MIYKTIDLKSKDIMVPLFKALVRPILDYDDYGNPVWTNGHKKILMPLRKFKELSLDISVVQRV